MINVLTMMRLLKPTFTFVLNYQRFIHLMFVPFVASFVFLLMESFYPLFFLASTAEVKLSVNVYMFVLLGVIILYLSLSLMLYIQQTVFFGSPTDQKKFFLPPLNQAFFAYLAELLYLFVSALLFATASAYILISLLDYILPMSDKKNLFLLLGVVILLPYFMIRFSFLLPAKAAGKKQRLWDSWKMTRRISPAIALMIALFLFLPLGIAAGIYSIFQAVVYNEEIVYFITNLCALFSVQCSCILYGTYMAYLYSAVVSQE